MTLASAVSRRGPALLLGLSLALAVLGAALWLRPHASRPVELLDRTLELEAALTTRQMEPRGLEVPPPREQPPDFEHASISEPEARGLFPISGPIVYDAATGYRYVAHEHQSFSWPEHPKGAWTRVTNAEGMREDHDFPAVRPDLFVLAAGDSHTEGMCDDAESWPNLLELGLALPRQGRTVEVYNTAVAGYSFFNELGALKKELPRAPDAFVCQFYAGNDFIEALRIDHLLRRTSLPPRPQGYWNRLMEAADISSPAVSQVLNQILYLRENPDEESAALAAALDTTAEIRRVCKEHGIPWIAVYIPSALDVRLPEWNALRDKASAALALAPADFEIANRLGDALLARLRDQGVPVLDLRPVFASEPGPWYWTDLHVNLAAQRRIAQLLLPQVEALLPRKR